MVEKLLTVKQVALMLSKSKQTIYRWLDEGLISQKCRIKGGYLIPESEVDKLIRKSMVEE